MINRMLPSVRLSFPRDPRISPIPRRSGSALTVRLGAAVLNGLLLYGVTSWGLAGPAAAQNQPHTVQQQAPAPKAPAAKPVAPAKTEPARPDPAKTEAAKPAVESAPAAAASAPAPEGTSGLPLPRFVSLRSDQVNMRAGPGARYPVDWVYMRRELPVEVIQEYETWRKIRDPDGAEGWVHQSMLTGRRTIMVRKDKAMLRRTADDTASAAAYLSQGVVGKLLQCPKGSDYCRVEVEGYQGWLRRNELWGAYKAEAIN